MGIKTVPQPPFSPDLAPCDFCLFPKLKENLRGCHYETIEEMIEAVTKVIDTLTQEDSYGAFQKLLERYNSWRRLFQSGLEFHVCTINKSAHTKKSLETYWRHLLYPYWKSSFKAEKWPISQEYYKWQIFFFFFFFFFFMTIFNAKGSGLTRMNLHSQFKGEASCKKSCVV